MENEKIEGFFNLAIDDDDKIIKILETDHRYRDVKNAVGSNIFIQLMCYSKAKTIKEILDKNLSGYGLFKSSLKDYLSTNSNKNDSLYEFYKLLKPECQESSIIKDLSFFIKHNSVKTLSLVSINNLIRGFKENKNSFVNYQTSQDKLFEAFARCDEDTFNKYMPIYQEMEYNENHIEEHIIRLKQNNDRIVIILDNLRQEMSEDLKTTLSIKNEVCRVYLLNKKLNKELKEKLHYKEGDGTSYKVNNIKI